MIHFRNKTDIVDWLEKNCPRRAIVRALREGQVELLGGFDYIVSKPRLLSGWIVRITSRHNKTWDVAVLAGREYQIRILKSVPWAQWIGSDCGATIGDNPDQYRKFKHEAKKRMAINSRSPHVSPESRGRDQQVTDQGMGEEG